MSHHVRIGQVATHCRFRATPARREVLRRAVDTTCQTGLGAALERALDPVLDGHDGVIRIRRLDLALTTLNPLDGALAHEIAARVAALVRRHLGQGKDGVQSWPSHAEFMAHYVLWRLGLRSGAAWAFVDFEALRLLSPQQASVEVIGARPEVLSTLAQDGAIMAAPEVFARTLDPTMAAVLLKRLCPEIDATLTTALSQMLTQHQALLTPLVRQATIGGAVPAPLVLVLRLIAELPADQAKSIVPELAVLAQIVAELAQLSPELLSSQNAPWSLRLASLASDPETSVISKIAGITGGEALLETLAALLLQESASAANAKPKAAAAKAATSLATPAAGLALLMPGLVQLTRDAPLERAQLRAVALAALPETARVEVAQATGFQQLFPQDPRAALTSEWPMPPTASLPAHLITAPDGAARWAQAAMAHFADRLPGLQESSARYLQDQFLTQPGDVLLTADTLSVALHRVPLGIVLSMGGHLGLRGCIPWLDDRPLSVTIKGGV